MFKIINTAGALTIENGSTTYGPYTTYPEMRADVEANDLHIMFEPKDLVFDIWVEEEDMILIYAHSKINPDADNLGGHNVTGLPYELDAEDMECCWSVEGVRREQAIEDMKALGATHEEFLNQNASPSP